MGTVGAGVAKQLEENRFLIEKRTGVTIQIIRAATLDPYEHLDIDFTGIQVSDSVDDILNDQNIDIVVELIGGTGIAKTIILEAFKENKSVVTANKALLAKYSKEVFAAAYASNGIFGYEASVGGGIPIIRNIKEGFSGDRIDEISGIMNGTANYILSSMTNERADFAGALKEAQDKGFAEADPTFDIEGIDTAHKVLILMELAFNAIFDFDQLYIEGITKIEPIDIELADELGYRIKLLGKALNTKFGYEGRVHPSLVEKNSLLASVHGPFNAISVYGNFVGDTMSYGAGAGSYPTASAVMADIIEISRYLSTQSRSLVPPLAVPFSALERKEILPINKITAEYYLRFTAETGEDVQERIMAYLRQKQIKVKKIFQKKHLSSDSELVYIAVLTGKASERIIQNTLENSNALPFIASPTKMIRVNI